MHPTISDIDYIKNLRGELDVTVNKKSITDYDTGYRLVRGRNIGYYFTVDAPITEYVSAEFAEKTPKRRYIEEERLVCQQVANMAKKRRVSFAVVPAKCVLGNSCNFISVGQNDDGVDMYFLMGVLNSSLIDRYFKLTSSNNHINNYEIDNFPIPVSYGKKDEISRLVQILLETHNTALADEIEGLVREAYGLQTDEEENRDAQGTDFSVSAALRSSFFGDLKIMIPDITPEECEMLLGGRLKTKELFSRFSYTAFNAKVVDGIVKKYTKLAQGRVLNHITFKLSDLDLEMISSVGRQLERYSAANRAKIQTAYADYRNRRQNYPLRANRLLHAILYNYHIF